MNSQELKDLLDYIQENNSWENMIDAYGRDRNVFKYIDICYDTRDTANGRDPHVWSLRLRQGSKQLHISNPTFEKVKNILDLPISEINKKMKDLK